MKYNAPPGSQDANASYVNGVPGVQKGSPVNAYAVEYTQREIVNVITSGGYTPTNDELDQLYKAILKIVGDKVPQATVTLTDAAASETLPAAATPLTIAALFQAIRNNLKSALAKFSITLTDAPASDTLPATTATTAAALLQTVRNCLKSILAKTIRVNLGSTSAAALSSSANVTPGVNGTLGPGNGGTGQTTLAAVRNALIALGAYTSANLASLGVAPMPTASAGVGQIYLQYSTTGRQSLPSGGTWYWIDLAAHSDGMLYGSESSSGISAGGTTVGVNTSYGRHLLIAFRIS